MAHDILVRVTHTPVDDAVMDALAEEWGNELRTAKRQLVAAQGVGSDLSPCVAGYDRAGLELCRFGPNYRGRTTEGSDQIVAAIALASSWQPALMVVFSEGYTRSGGTEIPERGVLAQQFAAGDQSVAEALSLTMLDISGKGRLQMQPYRYNGRRVVWLDYKQERIGGDDVLAGRIANACMRAMSELTPEPERLLFVALLHNSGWHVEVPAQSERN